MSPFFLPCFLSVPSFLPNINCSYFLNAISCYLLEDINYCAFQVLPLSSIFAHVLACLSHWRHSPTVWWLWIWEGDSKSEWEELFVGRAYWWRGCAVGCFRQVSRSFFRGYLTVQELFFESTSLSKEDGPGFCERVEEGARVLQQLMDFHLALQGIALHTYLLESWAPLSGREFHLVEHSRPAPWE